MGSIVKSGVMDGIATVPVFCPKIDKAAGSTSSGTRRFEHGQLQGGMHIHQGRVCWICVEYVYN